ncbi:M48 family metallopeptidase [Maribacter sp. 2307UL18-2]|uniref:M48 family metallopeptidase n=1 Tax=Maribacter sp. 2307UL18-2 TaxID=3386274 RepID=UPI0039BC6666
MTSYYATGPGNVPQELTKPSPSFKKHVWLSVVALIAFITLYFFLTIWFGRLAYNLFRGSGGLLSYGLGAGFAFLSFFMIKSIFFLTKREENPMRRYVTEEEEPILFDYLYKLADEAGAPRPHKVFLTDRVNASVSYDLSFLNLLFPSKKNLEIGLGLVNVLNLGEFKAVLAHEYGHFAQRSMLLGRYVYTAQQIAARIVGKRDILDQFLAGLSSVDIRIAWIGWILSILVWAIRSLIETCFGVVSIAERALSREMEFQADLVAVSMTGSDALIHALSKLQVADEAYENAIQVVDNELNKKRAVLNLYRLQTNYIERMAWLLDDESYGKSPKIAENNPQNDRVFVSRTYNPPKMWATHPADKDREENTKKRYIPAKIDTRSTKDLLSDAVRYEEEMTATLIATAKVETDLISDAEGIEAQNSTYFDWSFLHPKYQASYLNRYAFTNYDTIDDLYNGQIDTSRLPQIFSALYPKDLKVQLNQLKEIHEEIEALVISENEVVTVEKRRIWHRGLEIKRRDIPAVIDVLRKEEQRVLEQLRDHDIKCRRAHYEAAQSSGLGWPIYLKKLSELVHYTEHTISNLNDSARKFHNVLNVVLADGRVSSSELQEVLRASDDYYYAVRKGFVDSETLKLDAQMLKKMDVESYKSAFEEFTLTNPDKHVINDWIQVIDGWAAAALKNLDKLRNVALEQLLDTEDKIRDSFLKDTPMEHPAPQGIEPIKKYKRLLPGTERSIQRKLNFRDRFFQGDGLVASAAKFGVSGTILVAALLLGSYSQKSNMYIYNGLQTDILVTIDGSTYALEANEHEELDINFDTDYTIVTTTADGRSIETLETDFEDPSEKYIYNVAHAGAFMQYPVYYGYEGAGDDHYFGTSKWINVDADYILEEAPQTISTSSSNDRQKREVVMGYSGIDPYNLLSIVEDSVQFQQIVEAHVKWDETDSPYLMSWMNFLDSNPDKMHILRQRLANNKDEIYTLRALQDNADENQRIAVCEDHQRLASSEPDNANYHYLTIRCIEDELEKNRAFMKGHEKFTDHAWLAFAAAYSYAEIEEWQKSYQAFTTASTQNASLRATIGLDAERVRRVMAKLLQITIPQDQRIINEDIEAYQDMESGQLDGVFGSSNHVYYLISQGKLEEALTFTDKYPETRSRVLRVLAASEGVSPKILEEALAMNTDDGIDFDSVWLALGVAVREGANSSEYLNTLKIMGIDGNMLTEFIQLTKQRNTQAAEALIADLDFRFKSHFYALGTTILGKQAPQAWKVYTQTLLFANERQFIET